MYGQIIATVRLAQVLCKLVTDLRNEYEMYTYINFISIQIVNSTTVLVSPNI